MCVEADTGRFLWGLDLEERFGTQIPEWYAGQCPRLDGETAVLAPCGANVFMLGVNCRTGVTEWEAPAPAAWRMSHSSIADGVLAGRRVYVYAAIGGVAGVAADGPDRGRILWKTDAWKPSVIAPTPVVLPGDRVFLTAGYGGGGVVLQIARDGQTWSATVAREYNPRGGLACEQQTPIFWQGRLFGVLPKDAGARRNQFACADAEGVILWTSGPEHRFGLGPFLMVGDRLLVLDDEGTLTMARASAERFEPMARARVLQGVDSWGPMALAGTRLLVRDSKRMVCLELGVVR
jgi:outer membrane protein assembly factor BamB